MLSTTDLHLYPEKGLNDQAKIETDDKVYLRGAHRLFYVFAARIA